ncbi:MAG TPA: AraC family transcriptional regulator [Macromonas sp.]|nr:AraC family transcriptional regulator [Macromonas sp.]
MQKPILRVSSAVLSGAEPLIRQLGGQPHAIAAQVDLPSEALEHADLLVPVRVVVDFLEQAALACRCPTFGLQLGERSRMAFIVGPLWNLLRQARTVGEWCVDIARYFDLYTHAAGLSFEPQPDGAWLTWSLSAGLAPRDLQLTEFTLALCCQEIRQRCGPGWHPRAVYFRHAPPPDLSAYRRVFGPHLYFNQAADLLQLDQATLARELDGGAGHARQLVRNMLRLDANRMPRALPAQVESLVRATLPYGACSLHDVSEALGVSERTLQAHLQEHGRSFKDIKDVVRADLALKYLRYSDLGMAEIAEILGYSELSALSRSFRRWHGQSARSVRAARTLSHRDSPPGRRAQSQLVCV